MEDTVYIWEYQDWCCGKMEFECIKRYLLGFFPVERVLFLHEVIKGPCHLCVVFDEPSIEVCQSKENPNSFNHLWLWLFQDCFYLFLIHLNPITSDYHAEEVNFSGTEHAFFRFYK